VLILPVLIPRTRQHNPQHATPPLAALRLLCRLSPPLCRRALLLPWLLRLARRGAARRGVLVPCCGVARSFAIIFYE
jgi:hypothetical protein